MDPSIQKSLHDKLYDRRKQGALELEKLVRESLLAKNHEKIRKIVDQLCHDYAYAIHQPYARNGGLIGLAAASIALGPEVARYLEEIVPPVLACFTDHDARVRYYACESMYNIAKTSKGEILPFFNELFDGLAKLTADSEASVKNGSELLDRLIKDVVSDSATTYVSVLHSAGDAVEDGDDIEKEEQTMTEIPTAFSLPRFIPLLQERVHSLNPFTRMFLIGWISLLDSIPDLELVSHLPSFLGGLFRFLNDSNQDVVTATQHVLERFLDEIKLVARVNQNIQKRRKSMANVSTKSDDLGASSLVKNDDDVDEKEDLQDNDETTSDATSLLDDDDASDVAEDWVPGQGVRVDHSKIIDILVTYLKDSKHDHIQLTALRWIDSFFGICPENILPFVPQLLNQVLPALSSDIEQVRQAGSRVNTSLMEYIISLSDEDKFDVGGTPATLNNTDSTVPERAETSTSGGTYSPAARDQELNLSTFERAQTPASTDGPETVMQHRMSLDYEGAVNALTLQFLNEHEATRVAALSWLIMLQSKAPRKVLAAHDGTFAALLKTLSDTSDTVVTRDLQLLSQISKNTDDSYFSFFMVNLLSLFCTDRRLLETRGNLIVRQLCVNLSPERIYRTMAECLEKDEDVEFASIMVQNLNNNLITAPEMADLRRKLRNWDSRDGQSFFVALFRSWCHNAIATISLCLLAQAYEQAYNLLQIFADVEMTVNMLIQIDKLVQLLESPVFTYLRLQLLEPEKHPFLYKCLYGILMLLPQSAAFAALKNRLNSVSAIGYLHVPQRPGPSGSTSTVPAFERANRLKPRDDSSVKWSELLEKFKNVQDRARRISQGHGGQLDGDSGPGPAQLASKDRRLLTPADSLPPSHAPSRPTSAGDTNRTPAPAHTSAQPPGKEQAHKSKFSASNLSRFAKGKSKNK